MTDENQKQRLDRELIDFRTELRIALPGAQVLFALLVTIPFARGFGSATDAERAVYSAAFLASTLSFALLVAPISYHRLRFGAHEQDRLVEISNRLVIAGLFFLAVAICCAVFLISEYVFGLLAAIPATAAIALLLAWLWWVPPLSAPRDIG